MNIKTFLLSLVFVLATATIGFSQIDAITYKVVAPDYQYLIDANNTVRSDNDDKLFSGIELGLYKQYGDGFYVGMPLRFGVMRYPLSNMDVTQNRRQMFGSLGFNAMLRSDNGKALPLDAMIAPYVTGGFEFNYYGKENETLLNVPVAIGLNFNLSEGFSIQAQSEYHFFSTPFIAHSVGLMADLNPTTAAPKPKPIIEPVLPAAPSDKDADGVIDAEDKCPEVAGLAAFSGCPDTDGDGVEDSKDECPTVAGLAKFNGCSDGDGDGIVDSKDKCPTVAGLAAFGGCPDTDGDGVPDSADNCPKVAGVAKFSGCPDTDGDGVEDSKDDCPTVAGTIKGCPDSDKDGIKDSEDKCPKFAGPASNNGCPVVKEEDKQVLEFAKRGVEFETGSSIIKKSSYAILDDVAKIMQANPDYSMKISGYTDSQGREDSNLKLSQSRANACYTYLVNKGIAGTRMTHTGYGEASPIADNTTAAGRAKNRRVEFDIFFNN